MDVKLTILVPEELRRKAKAAAALRGVTLSDVIREALERLVQEQASKEAQKGESTAQED